MIPSSCLQAPKRGTLKTSVPAPVEKKKVRVFCGYGLKMGIWSFRLSAVFLITEVRGFFELQLLSLV